MATRIPNVRVTLFNRCGHWVMVEHAAVFDRLTTDFLRHG
jgi:2-hydroxy-6-oxonona-2,4-dienedioate hydrolase